MIHIHHIPGMTAAGRVSHVHEFTRGITVGDVIPESWKGLLVLNGQTCTKDAKLTDGDHVHRVAIPQDPVSIIVSVLISLAIGEVIRMLLPEPEEALDAGDERSPTHGFSRMRNIRVEGQPIARGYGRHRVAGTIINEFVEVNNGTGESTYWVLCCIGQGVVHRIAGALVDTPALTPLQSGDDTLTALAFINDNPVSNFSGVEMWVRLGTTEQDVVPGFEKAKNVNTINVFLTQDDIGTNQDAIADYNNADGDSVWDEFGFGYDTITSAIDGIEIIINFPQGLYNVDSNGIIQTTRWVLGIRFCKLDTNGNPVLGPGNGGNADDGWVRLPFEEFSLDRQSAFQLSFPTWLYDPADHVVSVPGDVVRHTTWSSGNRGWRTIAVLDAAHRPPEWPSSTGTCDEFMFETWLAFDITSGDGPFNFSGNPRYVCLFEYSSDGDENGVWCGFKVSQDGQWFPHYRVGKWDRTVTWFPAPVDGTTNALNKKWHHYVWTTKRYNSSHNDVAFYMDGVHFGTVDENIDIICPTPAEKGDTRFTFGFSNQIKTSNYSVKGWWDETIVRAFYATYSFVQKRYNGGAGQRANGANPDIVGLYHFDGLVLTDDGVYLNHAEPRQANLTFEAGVGLVTVTNVASRTRGKYRVQVVRVNGLPDASSSTTERRQDAAEWQLAVTWIDEAFNYPSAAYYAMKVPATEQLSSSAPRVTAIAELAEVRVWDKVSTISPSFRREWTRNTAWNVIDAATDPVFGGGSAFPIENVDMVSAQAFADSCDVRVYDGRGRRDFYRQEFESDANKILSPETFGSAFWSTGTAVVTNNTTEAPDGAITADELDDDSGVAAKSRGCVVFPGKEAAQWSFQLSVKKDLAATGASVCIEIVSSGGTVTAAFNIDDGTAVANCTVTVHPKSDNWWLVKVDVARHDGATSGSINVSIYPTRYTYGTTTEDTALTGTIEVWGAFLHRGQTHLAYPEDSGKARAFIYIGNVNDDGDAQVLPVHWAPGEEIRLRNSTIRDWDTPTDILKALKIQEVEELNEFDGYTRAWRITCEWYSDSINDRPSGTFPGLVRGSRDWEDVNDDWIENASGIGMLEEFDDGGITGGPITAAPLQSSVLNILANNLGDIRQQLSVNPGETITARALFALPDAGTNMGLRLVDGSTASVDISGKDAWETVEVTLVANSSVPDIEVFWINGSSISIYVDAVGCWVTEDLSGRVPGGEIEGAEALHTYDAVHDTFTDFWRTIVDMCLTARCIPVREGNRLRFKPDIKRTPVGIVTFASTVVNEDGESTFRVRYSNLAVRPNSYTIDFYDERHNWERSVAMKESASLEGSADSGLVRHEQFFMKGLTRRSAVVRHEKYLIAQNELLVHAGSFQTGPGAVFFEPGDILEVAHDLMPWGQSGRCKRGSGQNVNLLPSQWDDLAGWDVSDSGSISWEINVRPMPSGEPTADLTTMLTPDQVQVQKVVSGLTDGTTYVFSVYIRKKVAPQHTALFVTQEGSGTQTLLVEFAWATGTIAEVTGTGNAIKAEDVGDGWWRISSEYDVNGQGDVTFSVLPARGPTILGTRIYVGDAQVEEGTVEPSGYDRPGVGIFLDRKVILEPGESYIARVTNGGSGLSVSADVFSPAGEYLEGDLIKIDTASLGFNPARGDEYIIYTLSERRQVQIISLGLGEDSIVEVEWIDYEDAVYDGDDLSDDEVETSFGTNNGGRQGPDERDEKLPSDPFGIGITEFAVHSPGGAMETHLQVSWTPDPDTEQSVRENMVYIAYLEIATSKMGQLRHVATVPGGLTTALVRLPDSTVGRTIRVAVQPVSRGGMSVRPELCASQTIVLEARSPKPSPPTNFVASMEGVKITFKWDQPAENSGLVYEIRHGTLIGENAQGDLMGGWVLAQGVGETRESSFGPTETWMTCQAASAETSQYMLRVRNRHGVYSDVVTLDYSARVLNATLLDSSNWWMQYVSQAWHDYEDGWKTDSLAPVHDPDPLNLSRHADGYLFMDSGLTAIYTTTALVAFEAPEFFEREEPLRIEAIVYAICRNPTEVGEGDANSDGTTKRDFTPTRKQVGWSLKGNIASEGNLQGDTPTLRLQMRLVRDSSIGPQISTAKDSLGSDGWIEYKPGVFTCHGAQFRILLTRPSTDWDVRIHEFYVQVGRSLPERHYRTPLESRLARRHGFG